MNKQKLILPLFVILGGIVFGLFYYSAQINKQKNEYQAQINYIETQKQKDFFDKSLSCQNLINAIKVDLDEVANESDVIREVFLKEIFYSEKENSCLYVIEYYGHNLAEGPYLIKLINALTGATVDFVSILGIDFGSDFNTEYYNIDGSKNMEGWNKLEQFHKNVENKYK